MSEELELPISWLRLKLGDIIDYGKADRAEPSEIPADAWVLELEDIEKDTSRLLQRLTFAERQSKSTKNHFKPGDVLYGKLRPYLNKVIVADQVGYCTTEILPLKPHEGLYGRFLFYWLKHPEFLDYVAAVSHGINMPRLGTEAGLQAPFILAPIAEQKRIADKLDALLARVDQCRARLDRVPLILKRFRQAVLAAATSGQLTEDWRGDFEYQEYIHSAMIPTCWKALRIKDVAEVKGGKRLPNGEKLTNENTGFPYIRAGQLKNGTVVPDDQLYLSPEVQKAIARYTVQKGDLYITIVGACIGDAGVIPPQYDGANLTENAAKICDFMQPLDSIFAAYWLRSPYLQTEISQQIKSGAQGKLALSRIKELDFPLPSIAEQHEIVRRVETLFAYADRLEARYQAAQAQVEQLTPALLAKAFRGELVPQDPADEPATVLLARVRAARMESGEERPQPKQASLPFE